MEDFEKIYATYHDQVYMYVLKLCQDENLAEEVTQETFFKALKKIDEFRGESSIKVWLCQIAKNTYYDHVKRQGRHEELPDEYGEPQGSVEQEFFIRSDAKAMHRIIHYMEEPYKEVFSLRAFGELSFSDIGELFGKSDSWARVTYHRARLMIKEEMENGRHNM